MDKKIHKSESKFTCKTTLKTDSVPLIDYHNEFLYPEKGFSFHFWENTTAYPHSHNYFEFLIVTKGKLLHDLNGTGQTLTHKSLAFITPGDAHAIYPISGSESQHLNFAITPSRLKAICDDISPTLFTMLTTQPLHCNLLDKDYLFLMEKSKQLDIFHDSINDIRLFLIVNEIIYSLIDILYTNVCNKNSDYPMWFSELITKIESLDFETCTIHDIYKMSYFSPPTILKYFRQYKGETIVSYISKRKIDIACSMLLTSNQKILTISNKLGFDSLSHFNRTFKKYTGQTPSDYRKTSISIDRKRS